MALYFEFENELKFYITSRPDQTLPDDTSMEAQLEPSLEYPLQMFWLRYDKIIFVTAHS